MSLIVLKSLYNKSHTKNNKAKSSKSTSIYHPGYGASSAPSKSHKVTSSEPSQTSDHNQPQPNSAQNQQVYYGYNPTSNAQPQTHTNTPTSSHSVTNLYTVDKVMANKDTLLYNCVKYSCLYGFSSNINVFAKISKLMENRCREIVDDIIAEKKQKLDNIPQEQSNISNEFHNKVGSWFGKYTPKTYIYCQENNETFFFSASDIKAGKNPFAEIYDRESKEYPNLNEEIQELKNIIQKLTKHKLLLKLSTRRQDKLHYAQKKLAELEKIKSRLDTCKSLIERYEENKEDIISYITQIDMLNEQSKSLQSEIDLEQQKLNDFMKTGILHDKDYRQEVFEYILTQLTPEEREMYNNAPNKIYEYIVNAPNKDLAKMNSDYRTINYHNPFFDFVIDKTYEDVLVVVDEKATQEPQTEKKNSDNIKNKPEDEIIK